MYDMSPLKSLYLKQTRVSGTISEAIGALKELKSIDVREANLKGALPQAIGTLSKLKTLNVEDNAWRGWIPELPPTITECELTDKSFKSPYSSRINTPLKRGDNFGIGRKNAQFNCPLPPSMPKACMKYAYCSRSSKTQSEAAMKVAPEYVNQQDAPVVSSDGYSDGLVAGVVSMLCVMLVLACAGFYMRRKLVALCMAESKPMMQMSDTKNVPE